MKEIHLQLELISNYVTNIAIALDNFVYDDITATERDRKNMKKEIEENVYKLNLAVNDLQKQINKIVRG